MHKRFIWKRTSAHSGAKRYGPVHDTILFYSISKSFHWTIHYMPYDQHYIDQFFTYVDGKGRRWRRTDLTGPGVRKGDSGQVWRHYSPTYRGRHWQPPSFFYEKYTVLTGDDLAKYPLIERLDKLDDIGLVHWPRKADGVPQGKRLLEDAPGIPVQDVWTDIRPIHNQSNGFSLCFRSHQMLIGLLRSRHGFRTVPGDVRELLDLRKLVSSAVRQAGGPVFGPD